MRTPKAFACPARGKRLRLPFPPVASADAARRQQRPLEHCSGFVLFDSPFATACQVFYGDPLAIGGNWWQLVTIGVVWLAIHSSWYQLMSKSLVIVESPSKAKTINKYLGKEFKVLASVGHIKDLPKKGLGVDIENNFEPTYEVMPGKEKVVKEIKDAAKDAETVFIATDPDREGEAIGFHLAEIVTSGRGQGKKPIFRVMFNEITKAAVQEAFKHPSAIDNNLVDAQQARRVLDRLVGYKVSPLLWDKVRRGLSAGRVQTVAVRLVVEREREIQAFIKTEYWSVIANLSAQLQIGRASCRERVSSPV